MANIGKALSKGTTAARRAVVPAAGLAAAGLGIAALSGALPGSPIGNVADALSGAAGSGLGAISGLLDNWVLVAGVGGAAVVLILLLK